MNRIAQLLLVAAFFQTSAGAQTAQWSRTSLLPDGGNIIDLASDNAGTIYALSGYTSYIYYTTNNGQSWLPVQDVQNYWNVLDIEVDRVSKKLYVGTSSNGIAWTSNYGASWQQAYIYTSPTGGGNATFFQIGIKHGTGVVVGSEPSFITSPFYVSTNAGATWATHMAPFGAANDLQFLPGGELLAGTEDGVFKSTNNGAAWAPLNTGITGMQVRAIAIKSGWLFAGTDLNVTSNDSTGIGVYVSSDNGANWTNASNGLANKHVRALMADSASGNLYAATEGGLFVSADNAASWTPVNGNLQSQDLNAITRNAAGFFVCSRKSGVAFSALPNAGWNDANTGLTINSFGAMVMDGAGALYLQDAGLTGIYKKGDATSPWQQSGLSVLPAFPGRSMAQDGNGNLYDGSVTARGESKAGLYKSGDGGLTWTDISTAMPPVPAGRSVLYEDIECGPDNMLYVLASYAGYPVPVIPEEIFASADGGASWTSIRQADGSSEYRYYDLDVNTDGILFVTCMSVSFENVIIVSTDQGATFGPLSTGLISPLSGFDVRVDNNDAVYLVDNGNVYHQISSDWIPLNPPAPVSNMYFDHQNRMYATGEEVFRSEDGGTSWTNITFGLPSYNTLSGPTNLQLTDLVFDADNTPYGRSVQMDADAFPYAGIYRFSSASASVEAVTNSLMVQAYPNPATDQVTVSFLSTGSEEVRIRLYDAGGRLVQSPPAFRSRLGRNQAQVNVQSLVPGVYHLVVDGNGTSGQTSIIRR